METTETPNETRILRKIVKELTSKEIRITPKAELNRRLKALATKLKEDPGEVVAVMKTIIREAVDDMLS